MIIRVGVRLMGSGFVPAVAIHAHSGGNTLVRSNNKVETKEGTELVGLNSEISDPRL